MCQVKGYHDKKARTNTNTQNTTKTRSTPRRNRHLEKNYFCVFGFSFYIFFFIYNCLNDFSQICWVTALVRWMNSTGGLNQFSSISNLTLTQHFLEKKNKEICIYSLQPGHLEAEQNDRKVKRSKIEKKVVKKKNFKYKRLLPVKKLVRDYRPSYKPRVWSYEWRSKIRVDCVHISNIRHWNTVKPR